MRYAVYTEPLILVVEVLYIIKYHKIIVIVIYLELLENGMTTML